MMITETAAGTVLANGGGKIKRSSFKSRGGGPGVHHNNSGGGGGVRGYRAVRVTVPSTVVAELASKFNAVVVDADRGATARDIIKKVNKTLAKGAAVRATVEKFESAAEKKHGGGGDHVVVVRTNSSGQLQRTAAAAAELQNSAAAEVAASIVKRRMEQFQNGKRPPKPSVLGPKPKVAEATKRRNDGDERRRPALQKDSVAAITGVDHRRLLNKHKRLSIARDPDAQLESVLNATLPELQPESPVTDHEEPVAQPVAEPMAVCEPVVHESRRTPSPPKIRPKPNSSFLHGRKGPQQASAVATVDAIAAQSLPRMVAEPDCGVAEQPKCDDDGVHDYNYIDGSGHQPQAIYEELMCDIQMSAARTVDAPDPSPLPDVVTVCSYYDNGSGSGSGGDDCDHYTTIDGGEHNIYDDVVMVTAAAPEIRKPPAAATDEDGSYETVEAPPPPLPPALPVATAATAVHAATVSQTLPMHDGDDHHRYGAVPDNKPVASDNCSLEIDNSIYGLNAPSESTSSGVTSDSVSADRNSKFDLDEEWVDVDNTSDELQEIIVFRQKPKINDTITKGWSIQVRKQLTKTYVSISSQSVISFIKDVPEPLIFKKNKCDYLNEQLLSVVLKTVFLEEKFESQELSVFFDNEVKEKTNTISQEIPEEIYADYDSFESDDDSWDDCKDGVKVKRVPYPCENRDLPAPPSQQNIYGIVPLVKKAGNRMKKRWSLGSLGLNRIRKLSVGNFTTDFGNKISYGSTSDKSTNNKFNPTTKCNSLSSSVFYLNDPIYNNIENGQIRAPVRNASKPPSSVDSRRLSVARPSSPPPPPPPLPPQSTTVKRHSTGNNDGSLPRSISNSKGRPTAAVLDKSNTTAVETVSENGSNHGSDLYMRFADEPLYQFYAADISERTKSVFAGDMMEECDGYEEISSITSRPSALELITPCPSGHGQHRSLWCEVPEVKNSGIIDVLKPRERKLQEAKFELITSEASYFKSLTVLEKHFVNSYSMNDETILSKNDRKILFGNVNPVRKCSEKLLAALEKCWQEDILLKGLCEILNTHSKENFEIFVKYCSNQIYIDRTLKTLREKNFKFNEALHRLESDTKCQLLSLHSFLMLPMQRITRLPLLVDAILSQMDSTDNSLEYEMCELTLASLNSIVQNCNESTRKLERYEEMLLLSRQLEFSSKREIKAMSVASSSRWLVRSGSMLHLTSPDAKLTLSRKLIRPTKLYFFLFNDMFFIAKRKSDESYTVVDYCARNFVQMVDATDLVITSSYKNLLMLTILENHEAKTIEMLLSCDSESSKKRWIEAMSPPISSNPDETLYNEWDCPQVFSEHPYIAVQPDELSLQSGDIVKVLTKMNDGWYHGERIRDGEKGWFPGNYTSEIASQHARAKNLKQRYRLLAMSGSYLQSQQDKIKKK